jgi:hypothetical protein
MNQCKQHLLEGSRTYHLWRKIQDILKDLSFQVMRAGTFKELVVQNKAEKPNQIGLNVKVDVSLVYQV